MLWKKCESLSNVCMCILYLLYIELLFKQVILNICILSSYYFNGCVAALVKVMCVYVLQTVSSIRSIILILAMALTSSYITYSQNSIKSMTKMLARILRV